jgi:4-amino-4-deoxy-L-arabinose transferase-like glycosyltransferase
MQTPPSHSNSRWLVWLTLAFAVVWLATLGARKLLNPDEARYAEIPREMVATGDWLTPRLNDLDYFEKPPLQYWATAIAFEALGQTDFAARLWCGLTGLVGILFVGWSGARLFGRNAGIIAATLLAGSLMYFVLGHVNTLDMGLTLFLTVAVGAFLIAQQTAVHSKAERNFMLLAWAAAALALLSKGIVALALPVLALMVYTLVEREYSVWRRLHLLPGFILFFLIGAPWLIAVSVANPGFATFFFLHEHFARFLTDVHRRVEPWWYFIPYLIAGALPWVSLVPGALANTWRIEGRSVDADQPGFRPRRFLIIWMAVILVFFSLSHSKLPPYILPIFPALALLVGDYVVRAAADNSIRKHFIAIGILWALVLGYLVVALTLGPLPHRRGITAEQFIEVFRWAATGMSAALIGAIMACVLVARSRVRLAFVSMSAGTFLALSVLIVQFDAARSVRSGYDLAQSIKPHLVPGQPFYNILTYDHAIAFYLERAVTLVEYSGELEFGQSQEPGKLSMSLEDFKQAWPRDPSGSIAVMKLEAFELLAREGTPMDVIDRNLQLVAVKKP